MRLGDKEDVGRPQVIESQLTLCQSIYYWLFSLYLLWVKQLVLLWKFGHRAKLFRLRLSRDSLKSYFHIPSRSTCIEKIDTRFSKTNERDLGRKDAWNTSYSYNVSSNFDFNIIILPKLWYTQRRIRLCALILYFVKNKIFRIFMKNILVFSQ